jgi:predicted enzyme related to lactoylglutathione lyase
VRSGTGGDGENPTMAADAEHRVFRSGGISYLRIPATDPCAAAAFYRDVFGWKVDLDHGGAVVTRADPEGDLWVAVFRDPAGDVVGAWQQGPRAYPT